MGMKTKLEILKENLASRKKPEKYGLGIMDKIAAVKASNLIYSEVMAEYRKIETEAMYNIAMTVKRKNERSVLRTLLSVFK